MKSPLIMLLAASYSLGFATVNVVATTPIEVEKVGPAILLVDASRDRDGFIIKLADVLTITVQIGGTKTSIVKPPERITKSPGWRLLEVTPASIQEQANKQIVWRQSYTLEPLAPGDLSLALEPFSTSEGGTVKQTVVWRPLLIRVRTGVATPDLKALRDPVVIERLPPVEEPETWPWFALGGGLLAVIVATLGYRWWRRRSRPRAGAAEERAMRQLDRMVAYHLPERNEIERFHTLLANILRRYLERKFHLPARRRTTREFLELLQASSAIADSDKDSLVRLFTSCDLSKFARADVSVEECVARAAKARAFIGVCSTPVHGQTSPIK